MSVWRRLFWEEEGQGMVEYGLILALVAVAAIVAFNTLGEGVVNTLSKVTGEFPDISGGGGE